jgi:hypothetical protein
MDQSTGWRGFSCPKTSRPAPASYSIGTRENGQAMMCGAEPLFPHTHSGAYRDSSAWRYGENVSDHKMCVETLHSSSHNHRQSSGQHQRLDSTCGTAPTNETSSGDASLQRRCAVSLATSTFRCMVVPSSPSGPRSPKQRMTLKKTALPALETSGPTDSKHPRSFESRKMRLSESYVAQGTHHTQCQWHMRPHSNTSTALKRSSI